MLGLRFLGFANARGRSMRKPIVRLSPQLLWPRKRRQRKQRRRAANSVHSSCVALAKQEESSRKEKPRLWSGFFRVKKGINVLLFHDVFAEGAFWEPCKKDRCREPQNGRGD